MHISGDNIQGFATLALFVGLVETIFWMFVGWRAMRAHERIAEASEEGVRRMRASDH
jgi:uncharacterized membrane protein